MIRFSLNRMLIMMAVSAAMVILAGCNALRNREESDGDPVVRATDGATASVVIISCPPTENRAIAVGDLIRALTQRDELAIARSGGTARLVIDACPEGRILAPPALPPSRRR